MTVEEKQSINRSKRNALAEVAVKTGAIDRVNKILSAIHILQSQSAVFQSDAEDILNSHGLRGGKLVALSKTLEKASKAYFDEFVKLVLKEQVLNWANDLDAFDVFFRKFSSLTEEFEPDLSEIDIEEINKNHNVNLKLQ